MYSTVKMQSIRDSAFGLEDSMSMTKTIFTDHSERSSALTRSQELYRKVQNSDREPRNNNVRESTMTLICNNCKKPGHRMKYCK